LTALATGATSGNDGFVSASVDTNSGFATPGMMALTSIR
jgi:hypothetical protein